MIIVGRTPWSAADPPVGLWLVLRFSVYPGNLPGMTCYRRRLPHLDEIERSVFLTWRLYGSLPPNRAFPAETVRSGKAFVAMDRLLDEAHSGPFYLRESAIADMIVEAIQYNATILRHYALHAFVVMPNHVHLLATPAIALPKLTKSLKGITAKRANAMLALAGTKFWQEKSYDHLVRSAHEFGRSGIIWRRIRYGQVWFAMPAIIVGRGGRPGGRPRTRGSALQLTS
jgi:putative transposase